MDPPQEADHPQRRLRPRADGKVRPPTPPPPKPSQPVPQSKSTKKTQRQSDPPGAPGPDPELKWEQDKINIFYRVVGVAARTGRYTVDQFPLNDTNFFKSCFSSKSEKIKGSKDAVIRKMAKMVHADEDANKDFAKILKLRLKWEDDNKVERRKFFARTSLRATDEKKLPTKCTILDLKHTYTPDSVLVLKDSKFKNVVVQLEEVVLPQPSDSPATTFTFMPNGGYYEKEDGSITFIDNMCSHASGTINPIVCLSDQGHTTFVRSLLTAGTCASYKSFVAGVLARPKGGELSEDTLQKALGSIYNVHKDKTVMTEEGEVTPADNNLFDLTLDLHIHSAIEVIYCSSCKRWICRLVNIISPEDAKLLRQGMIFTQSVECILENCEQVAQRLRAKHTETPSAKNPVKSNRSKMKDPLRPALRRLQPNPHGFIVDHKLGNTTIANMFKLAGFKKRITLKDVTYVVALLYFWYELLDEPQVIEDDGSLHYLRHAINLVYDKRTDKLQVVDSNEADSGLQEATDEKYKSLVGSVAGVYYVREDNDIEPGKLHSLEELQRSARQKLEEELGLSEDDLE